MHVDRGESESQPIIHGTMSSSCKNDTLVQERCTVNVVVSVPSCDDDDASATPSAGALAFAHLKLQSERQKTTLAALEKKKRKEWSGGRKSWLSVLEDCFSLSSLEVDLGSEYEIDDIDYVDDVDDVDDVNDVDHESDEPPAEDRFRSSSGRDSMDSIPAQPLSSERDVRRAVSHGELRQASLCNADEDERFVPGIGRCCSLDFYNVGRPKDLASALRESRWSSSSDKTMRQDALNVLLDKVSSSHHDVSRLVGPNDDDDIPYLPRRQSMADCEDRLAVPQSRKGTVPGLSRRVSSPHDHRWQGGLSISPQDSAIPSPSRFRRGRDH